MCDEARAVSVGVCAAAFTLSVLFVSLSYMRLRIEVAEHDLKAEEIRSGLVQQHVDGRSEPIWVKPKSDN